MSNVTSNETALKKRMVGEKSDQIITEGRTKDHHLTVLKPEGYQGAVPILSSIELSEENESLIRSLESDARVSRNPLARLPGSRGSQQRHIVRFCMINFH